jgi:carbonic anhydrase
VLVQNLKKDVLASIVVFLVAIPLSLGIAFASGAPIIAGVIAAAVGGIVVGSLGGAPLQVSGPAAGMTVIVFGVVQSLGWQAACLATAIAGVIQIVLGKSKIARMALAISPAVMYGMLAGIGITIVTAQLQVVLGGTPASGVIKNLAQIPQTVAGANLAAVALGAMAFGILLLWPKVPKKVQLLPGALVAVAVPTLVSVALNFPVKRIELPSDILGQIKLPTMPAPDLVGPLLASALTIALVASVESLLSAAATDKLHQGPRADLDKELVGQGAANTVSGLLGGLPVTGVIVRSSANINAGAQSRLSSILHGVWVLVFVLLLGSLLESIPLAALAGLLVHVGVKLVDAKQIRLLAQHRELPVYLVTVAGVAGLDLITGVGLGLGLSLFLVLRRMATTEMRLSYGQGFTRVEINGSLTFLNVPRLMQTLNTIPPGERVEVEIHADFMDHAAFESLHSWERSYLKTGGQLSISEPHEEWYAPATQNLPRSRKSPIVTREGALVSE